MIRRFGGHWEGKNCFRLHLGKNVNQVVVDGDRKKGC